MQELQGLVGRKAGKTRPTFLTQCLHSNGSDLYVISKYSMMEISEKEVLKLFEKWQHKLNKY